jgi:hypothetical protein
MLLFNNRLELMEFLVNAVYSGRYKCARDTMDLQLAPTMFGRIFFEIVDSSKFRLNHDISAITVEELHAFNL